MIELLTSGTPNGHKISILLEELSVEYKVTHVDLARGEQKRDCFLRLNPNGKIPVIVDHNPSFQSEPFAVFESGAIMIYLAEKYGALLPTDMASRIHALQWLMFQVGGVGPMMGQSNVFRHYAPCKIEYAIDRYQKETRRLLEVLNKALEEKQYLAGEYSIADIANYSWVRGYEWSGASVDGLENLIRWMQSIYARPAVQAGIKIPCESLGGTLENNMKETIAAGKSILV
jgi:glutathione S-transferase